jgi:hypothetical protein
MMSKPVWTATVIVEEMDERWRGDYPILNIQEFDDPMWADNWCRNFIKSPQAGGPTCPYMVKWSIVFGVAQSSGEYGGSGYARTR